MKEILNKFDEHMYDLEKTETNNDFSIKCLDFKKWFIDVLIEETEETLTLLSKNVCNISFYSKKSGDDVIHVLKRNERFFLKRIAELEKYKEGL